VTILAVSHWGGIGRPSAAKAEWGTMKKRANFYLKIFLGKKKVKKNAVAEVMREANAREPEGEGDRTLFTPGRQKFKLGIGAFKDSAEEGHVGGGGGEAVS